MVNCKQILKHFMYRDRCDVYRAVERKVGKSDDLTRAFVNVDEQIPCHLGKAGKDNPAHRDDTSEKLTYNLRLYCAPGYSIKPNDVIEIQHEGQELKFLVGTVFEYRDTVEIELVRRLEAGQR